MKEPPHRAILFGYETALELLDAATRSPEVPREASSRPLPPQPPRKNDVRAAILGAKDIVPDFKPSYPVHVVAGDGARCRPSQFIHPHTCSLALKGSPTVAIDELGLVSIPCAPLLFVQMAGRLTLPHLVELGYEMCGVYRRPRNNADTVYNAPPMTSVSEIGRFVKRNSGLDGARKATRALLYIADGSASPRETKSAMVLGMPRHYGAYNLGTPIMNHEFKCSPEAYALCGTKTVRCDLYWPSVKLAVEYQSREFHQGELKRIQDSKRANALRAMGVTVVFITDQELESLTAMDVIATSIRKLMGKRDRHGVKNYHTKKLELRRQLNLPVEPTRTFDYSPAPFDWQETHDM